MNPQLPPLPEPELIVDDDARPSDSHSFLAYTNAAMTAYGLQCAEEERARILTGLDRMSDQCRALGQEREASGDAVGLRFMRHRLQELALVRNLVNGK